MISDYDANKILISKKNKLILGLNKLKKESIAETERKIRPYEAQIEKINLSLRDEIQMYDEKIRAIRKEISVIAKDNREIAKDLK